MKVMFADGSSEEYQNVLLGSGTQGEVYLSLDGRSVVKLYKDRSTDNYRHRTRIETLMGRHNPVKSDSYWGQFLTWPEKLVVSPRIGYSMPYTGMKSIAHYLFSRSYKRLPLEEKGWFIGRIASAMHLVNVASLFARMGLCYPDFSDRNVLVDPYAGRMILIDCDSLMHIDRPDILSATVQGTSSFRAPELVAGVTRYPTVITDRHALAVILYRWLLLGKHPLIGDRICSDDPDLDEMLSLGSQALYIEHPGDLSNHASEQVLKASALGGELEDMFRKAFVDGLHNPNARPLPFQWQDALRYTFDRLLPCTSTTCEWRFFVAKPARYLICPACSTHLAYPRRVPFLYLHRHRGSRYTDDYNMDTGLAHYVAGWPGRTLQQWHIKSKASPHHSSTLFDMSDLAIFELDPDTNTWYLKNLALPDLSYSLRGNHTISWQPCPIGACIPLSHSMLLQFGVTPDYFRGQIHLERSSEGAEGSSRKVKALPSARKEEPYPFFDLSHAQRLSISAGNLPEIALGTTGKVLPLLHDTGTRRRYGAL